MAKFLIGCDIGTSSAKAVLMDLDGNILASHYVEYKTYAPQPGWVEHDPEDYWRVFKENMQVILSKSSIDPREVGGISVSACSPCCVLVDKDGRTLSNSQIWMDRRAVDECNEVRAIYDDETVFQVSANPLDPHCGTIKLLWEKYHHPEQYRAAYKMLNPANFINMRLTGEFVTDYSNASLVGVAFDIVKREWRTDMLERIGLDPEKFARLAPCHEVIGEVTTKAALECGLAAGTPVVAGTVDCNAAWLGNGSTQAGDASLVMGTAGALGVVHAEPRFTRNLTTIIHTADSEHLYTTLAGTSCCGGLLRYLRDCFTPEEAQRLYDSGEDIYDLFNREAAAVPVGSDGLIVLPYFSGERTPLWNPIARGLVFGVTLSHKRGHWVRALMESGIYAIYHCLQLMYESNLPITSPILVSEGGAKSPLWRQIAADIMNVELTYMKEAKGAPTGNAINAGVGVGLLPDYNIARRMITVDQTHKPDFENHKKYARYYNLYRKLYEDNKENYKLLYDLRND